MAWRFVLRALQPRPRPQPATYLVHGRPRTDPFAWMDSAPLREELVAEARFCKRALGTKRLIQFQTKVTEQLEAICASSDVAVREEVGGFEYWLDSGPCGHPQLWRRPAEVPSSAADHPASPSSSEGAALVLDLATCAQQHPRARWELILCRPSDDGRWVACLLSANGQPDGHLIICSMDGTTEPEDWLEGPVITTVEWTSGGTLLYTVADTKLRPCELFEHVLGEQRQDDVRLFVEPQEQRLLQLGRTKDRRFATLLSRDKQKSQAWVRPSDASPGSSFRSLPQPPSPDAIAVVEHHSGRLLLGLSGASPAGGIRVLMLDVADVLGCSESSAMQLLSLARPWIPEEVISEAVTTDLDVFQHHVVLFQRSLASQDHRLCVVDMPAAGQRDHRPPPAVRFVPLPPYTTPHLCANQDFTSGQMLLSFSSLAGPPLTLLSLNLTTLATRILAVASNCGAGGGGNKLHHQDEPISGLNTTDKADLPGIVLQRHYVGDVGIPVTVAHRDGLNLSRDTPPALLCVYGAYGEVLSTAFHFERRWLLQQGWVVALLHVRGGGEKGAPWHEAGRRSSKRHSALDFIAACRWLHAAGVTAPQRTAVHAFSAGALIPTAALPMLSPGERLFRSLVLESPFLDMTTMALNPNTALMAHEVGEWGDARNSAAEFDSIVQFCPYENLHRVEHFPDIYASVCCDDRLTPYRNALKYVCRARLHRSRPLVILRCAPRGGHHGMECPSEAAARIAFLHDSLGIP